MSPLSSDPAKRAAQLANLRAGAGAPPGNQRAVTHGAFAQLARQELDAEERAIYDALAADNPALTAIDAAIVTLAAECRGQLSRANAEIRSHGALVQRGKRRGEVRRVAEYARRLRAELAGYVNQLNATQTARAAIMVDLATAMADRDEDALRRAGLIDG